MLNALAGTDSEALGAGSILDTVTSGDLTSISGLGSVLGSSEDLLNASQGLSNFSGILETYMNAQNIEAVQMSEKLSGVLEEAAKNEETSTLSYRTVQEIYEYFQERTGSAGDTVKTAEDIVSGAAQTSAQTEQAVGQNVLEVDFDSLERQIQQGIESGLPYGFRM